MRSRGGSRLNTSTRVSSSNEFESSNNNSILVEDEEEEADEVKDLREKFGSKLSSVKEIIPTWSDEDILFALQEASGDVSVAVMAISEG